MKNMHVKPNLRDQTRNEYTTKMRENTSTCEVVVLCVCESVKNGCVGAA